ncbi:hypothetical protein ACFSBU_20900 [Thalassotalea marina]
MRLKLARMIEFLGGKVTPDKGKICFKSKKTREVFNFSANRCKFHVFNDLPANSMFTKFCQLFLILMLLGGCNKAEQTAPVSPRCIEGQSHCQITIDDAEVSITFNREKLVAEQGFQLLINVKSPKAITSISAYMEGEDMYMGKIPLLFEKSGKNQFIADGLFGSCGQPEMTWRVWIFINGNKQQSLSFTVPSYLR